MSRAHWQHVEVAGVTDVGRKRGHNEDSFLVDGDLGLLLVADGVGGQEAGEIASRTAVEVMSDFLFEYDPDLIAAHRIARGGDPETTVEDIPSLAPMVIQAAVTNANKRIVQLNRMRNHGEGGGMGTTIAGVWLQVDTGRAVVFHIGDSRVYRFRNGEFLQMTRDHTLYEQWLDQGAQGDAPRKNIITRALGPFQSVLPDVTEHDALSGDLYLVCSDGLSSMIGDEDIAGALRGASGSLEECCRELVRLANEAGGADNVTVALARVS